MSDLDRVVAEIRQGLDALARPPAKCAAPSLRERSEERAMRAFRHAVEASGLSQRAVARRLDVCERIVRDYLHGARAVPVWAVAALNLEGQIAFARSFTAGIVEDDDEARCA